MTTHAVYRAATENEGNDGFAEFGILLLESAFAAVNEAVGLLHSGGQRRSAQLMVRT
jgi:hypothetical protein